jgi:Protein of unknown function (DUF3153)
MHLSQFVTLARSAIMGRILIRSNVVEKNYMKTIIDRSHLDRLLWRSIYAINSRLSILFCLVTIALSGCVKYDTGINFHGFNDGEIVQHIQLGDRLNSFNPQAVNTWLASLEQRTTQAQGRLNRLSDREFEIVIPFASTQELVAKTNRFFNPNPTTTSDPESKFHARLQIEQSNWLAIVKTHLIYDLDLRAISTAKTNDRVALSANDFVDLKFRIDTPFGIQNSESSTSPNLLKTTEGHQTVWQLQPGQIDRIDVVFWLPNPLGIGAFIIILVSIIGYYVKYRQFPWQSNSKFTNPL